MKVFATAVIATSYSPSARMETFLTLCSMWANKEDSLPKRQLGTYAIE